MMLTRAEAGVVLRLGMTTVDGLIKRGELPSVMVGGSRRVRMADLVAYINSLQPDLVADRPTTHHMAFVSGQVLVVEPQQPAPALAAA